MRTEDSIRLGLRVVGGLRKERALEMLEQRAKRPFRSMKDFKARCALGREDLRTLAAVGALNCFAEHRRDALWKVEKTEYTGDLFAEMEAALHDEEGDPGSPLPAMTPIERLHTDYQAMSLSTGAHPMALVRAQLRGVWRASDLPKARSGEQVRIAGHVICRQRPGTAKGFVFISLEDETGVANAIVAPPLFEQLRLIITQESFLIIEGRLQNTDGVVVVKARHIDGLQHEQLAGGPSHDFH